MTHHQHGYDTYKRMAQSKSFASVRIECLTGLDAMTYQFPVVKLRPEESLEWCAGWEQAKSEITTSYPGEPI